MIFETQTASASCPAQATLPGQGCEPSEVCRHVDSDLVGGLCSGEYGYALRCNGLGQPASAGALEALPMLFETQTASASCQTEVRAELRDTEPVDFSAEGKPDMDVDKVGGSSNGNSNSSKSHEEHEQQDSDTWEIPGVPKQTDTKQMTREQWRDMHGGPCAPTAHQLATLEQKVPVFTEEQQMHVESNWGIIGEYVSVPEILDTLSCQEFAELLDWIGNGARCE